MNNNRPNSTFNPYYNPYYNPDENNSNYQQNQQSQMQQQPQTGYQMQQPAQYGYQAPQQDEMQQRQRNEELVRQMSSMQIAPALQPVPQQFAPAPVSQQPQQPHQTQFSQPITSTAATKQQRVQNLLQEQQALATLPSLSQNWSQAQQPIAQSLVQVVPVNQSNSQQAYAQAALDAMERIRAALREANHSVQPCMPGQDILQWLSNIPSLWSEWKQMEPRFHAAARAHQEYITQSPPAVSTMYGTWQVPQTQRDEQEQHSASVNLPYQQMSHAYQQTSPPFQQATSAYRPVQYMSEYSQVHEPVQLTQQHNLPGYTPRHQHRASTVALPESLPQEARLERLRQIELEKKALEEEIAIEQQQQQPYLVQSTTQTTVANANYCYGQPPQLQVGRQALRLHPTVTQFPFAAVAQPVHLPQSQDTPAEYLQQDVTEHSTASSVDRNSFQANRVDTSSTQSSYQASRAMEQQEQVAALQSQPEPREVYRGPVGLRASIHAQQAVTLPRRRHNPMSLMHYLPEYEEGGQGDSDPLADPD
ncbi:Nn.00g100150.m01.CDS01 [Neocucurbitaria sp. VM-36]